MHLSADGTARSSSSYWYADDTYGYIDLNGKEVVPCKYVQVTDFNKDGLCTVAKHNGDKTYGGYYYDRLLYGVMDKDGRTITSAQWRTMGTSTNKDWNDYEYSSMRSRDFSINQPTFVGGRMKVQNPEGKWGFINQHGQVLGQVKWESISDFTDGMAMVKLNGLWGYVNEQGQQVGEVAWKKVNDFRNGLAGVQDYNGKWGFINNRNEVVIPCQYAQVMAFRSDGTCDVKTTSGTWVVIDKTGSVSFFGH